MDASGFLISEKIPGIERIGVSLKTVSDLELDVRDVEEKYKPPSRHIGPLKKTLGVSDPQTFAYIQEKRIEIDSVLAEATPERFWKYVLSELKRAFPTRNYRRAIRVDSFELSKEIFVKLMEPYLKRAASCMDPIKEDFLNSRSKVKGFLNLPIEVDAVKKMMREALEKNDNLRNVREKIMSCLDSLPQPTPQDQSTDKLEDAAAKPLEKDLLGSKPCPYSSSDFSKTGKVLIVERAKKAGLSRSSLDNISTLVAWYGQYALDFVDSILIETEMGNIQSPETDDFLDVIIQNYASDGSWEYDDEKGQELVQTGRLISSRLHGKQKTDPIQDLGNVQSESNDPPI